MGVMRGPRGIVLRRSEAGEKKNFVGCSCLGDYSVGGLRCSEVVGMGSLERVDDVQQHVAAHLGRPGGERQLEVQRAQEGVGVAAVQVGVDIAAARSAG